MRLSDAVGSPKWVRLQPTFSNSWVLFDDTNASYVYLYKGDDGWVSLTGLLKSGSTGTAFTLPGWAAPNKTWRFAVPSSAGASQVDVVASTGAVYITASAPTYLDLSPCRWRTFVPAQ